ncbi:hypothetical protein JOE33_004021 [Pseudomonas sp. PvP027]|nr:hypothetical protein [Pseudomonas sp. PvP027]
MATEVVYGRPEGAYRHQSFEGKGYWFRRVAFNVGFSVGSGRWAG